MASENSGRGEATHESGRRAADGVGLATGATPTWAIFGVSLAILAPASTLGLAIGTVAASAGPLSWLTWLVTSMFVLGFGGAIAWLARRFTSSGGVYGLAAQTGNRPLSSGVMVAQLLSVLIAGPACVIGSAIYLQAWLERLGAPHSSTALLVVCGLVVTGGIVAMGVRELKTSATLLLALEFFTVGVILVLFVLVLVRTDGLFDRQQFQFKGVSASAILTVAAFSIFSMAGFENAATLGREARDPKRGISFAVLASIGAVAVLYVVGSYVFVLGTKGLDLSATSAPLDALASHIGAGWLNYLLDLGIAVSFFGSAGGILAACSRAVRTAALDGVLPKQLTGVSVKHKTPVAAVAALGVFYTVVVVCGCVFVEADTSYGALGTFSGYCLVVTYGLVAIAAGLYAVRTVTLSWGLVVSLLASLAGVLVVALYSFRPFPEGTYGVVAVVFLIGLALGAIAVTALWLTRSPLLDLAGASDRAESPAADR